MKLSTIYRQFDVLIAPFPFTDRNAKKVRPVVVLSHPAAFGPEFGQYVVAMVTSARHSTWPLDVQISDLAAAGLSQACVVRFKLFTLDWRVILGRAGTHSLPDQSAVHTALSTLFGGALQA